MYDIIRAPGLRSTLAVASSVRSRKRGLRNFRGECYGLVIFGSLFHGRGVAECVVVVSRAPVHRTRFQMAG